MCKSFLSMEILLPMDFGPGKKMHMKDCFQICIDTTPHQSCQELNTDLVSIALVMSPSAGFSSATNDRFPPESPVV